MAGSADEDGGVGGGGAAHDEWVRVDVEDHLRGRALHVPVTAESDAGADGFRIEEASRSGDGIFADYIARAV